MTSIVRFNRITICLIFFSFFNSCKNITLSSKITYFYSSYLNDDLENAYTYGINIYHMKYLLDTIIKAHYNINDKDSKICLFHFRMFGNFSQAYFIDNNDTFCYIMKEQNNNEPNLLNGTFRINKEPRKIKYSIIRKKTSLNEIEKFCPYRLFFENKHCLIDQNIYDNDADEIILRFWNDKRQEVKMQFYEIYGDTILRNPNIVRDRQSIIKSGIDKKSIIKQKYIFIN